MSNVCSACRKPKATTNCEICETPLCKGCVQFVEPATFSFLNEIPEVLSHSRYCLGCFDQKVSPELAAYDDLMKKARNLYVFFITQKRQPPILKRSKETIKELDRTDRDETVLRLAFTAAKLGFNAIIETDIIAVKTRSGAYQKTLWQGSALPVQVDVEKLERVTRDRH